MTATLNKRIISGTGLTKEQYAINTKRCPVCGTELREVYQADGEDDFDITGLFCTNCDYRLDY